MFPWFPPVSVLACWLHLIHTPPQIPDCHNQGGETYETTHARWLLLVAGASTAMLVARPIIELRATLLGWNEVPSVSTAATGKFTAQMSDDGASVTYVLEYADLQGTVTQAHIHVADVHVNGGISVWLCSNLASPPTPPGVQACPAPPATITGTFTESDVVGPAGQGIAPGEYDELVEAIRRGLAYANVHSTSFPGGEVRGQISVHPPGQASH